jgi:hypothetical protein
MRGSYLTSRSVVKEGARWGRGKGRKTGKLRTRDVAYERLGVAETWGGGGEAGRWHSWWWWVSRGRKQGERTIVFKEGREGCA